MDFTYPLWVNLLGVGLALGFFFARPGHRYEKYRKLFILGGIGSLCMYLPPLIHSFYPFDKDTQQVLKVTFLGIDLVVVVAVFLILRRIWREDKSAGAR